MRRRFSWIPEKKKNIINPSHSANRHLFITSQRIRSARADTAIKKGFIDHAGYKTVTGRDSTHLGRSRQVNNVSRSIPRLTQEEMICKQCLAIFSQ